MTQRPRKIDFGNQTNGRPIEYAAHRNGHWLEKAANPLHPLVLRVYFVALGRRRAGGHAPLDRGELGDLLVTPGGKIPDRRRTAEAIQQCVKWGYLAEGSNALCLVVPDVDVQGGSDAPYRCRKKHTTRSAQAHKADCRCARCSQVSVPSRTHEVQVSACAKDTSPPSVRPEPDTSGGDSLFYLLPTATDLDDSRTTDPRPVGAAGE